MAYNHGREDRKWRIWKEAEEKLLRECGVDEATIEQIRMADRADFNSNRRFYRWTNDVAEYLEDMAGRERQAEVGTVAELLEEIESENLYQVLVTVDGRTLKIVLLKMQGYSTKEIAPLVHLTTGAIYARLDHLRKKLRKILWMWRAIIARRHDIVYGKFFDKKAGFISKKWLPVFANYRRDGYDFDALYDDGKAPNKHKKIMVNFMEDNADSEIYSNELKKQAGFGKDGEKGFDGAITNLMMQTYLCNCDFKKRVNKRGIEYGWDVAVYSSIEHIYGYDYVTSCYKDNPQDSWKQLVDYMHEMFPDATDKQIRKVLK